MSAPPTTAWPAKDADIFRKHGQKVNDVLQTGMILLDQY